MASRVDELTQDGADVRVSFGGATGTARRDEALALLQKKRDLDVTYTLPVMPDGLEKTGPAILADATGRDVDVSAVNIMAMNCGPSYDGDMGGYAEQAAEAAHDQLTDALGLSDAKAWRALHITAMIGVNDIAGETFTLADARSLRSFARRKGVGALSLWATFRDQECASGESTSTASDSCSGVEQEAGAFGEALAG